MKREYKPVNKASFGNGQNVKSYSIKNNRASFEILSKKVYSNVFVAITRELATNAFDSHVAAGKKDEPIHVHLPTALEPVFYVEDFGVGMDSATVEDIFTTYFETTKEDDNEQDGCLGLGSKSPFGYSDNFTITATRDGVRCIYTSFINDAGEPDTLKMAEFATDEPNGVKIEVPVKNERDRLQFIAAAYKVYKFFEVMPKFIGFQPANLTGRSTKHITPNVAVTNDGSVVIMGNVAYTLNTYEIPDAGLLRRDNFELTVERGAVDFQPSREGLNYSEKTIACITGLMKEVEATVDKDFTAILDQNISNWDKTKLISKMALTSNIHEYLKHAHYAEVFKFSDNTYYDIFGYNDPAISSNRDNEILKEFNVSVSVLSYGKNDYGNDYVNGKNSTYWHFYIGSDKYTFVKQTGPVGIKANVGRYIMNEKDLTKRYVVVSNGPDKTRPARVAEFIEMYGNPNNVLTEDDIKTDVSDIKHITLSGVREWIKVNKPKQFAKWGMVKHIPNGQKYYIKMKGGKPVFKNSYAEEHGFHEFMSILIDHGFKIPPSFKLYGVFEGNEQQLDKSWINFETSVDKFVKQNLDDWTKIVALRDISVYDVIKNVSISDKSDFASLKTNAVSSTNNESSIQLLRSFDKSHDRNMLNYKLKFNEIVKTKPLIKFMSSKLIKNHSSEAYDAISEYINGENE